MSKFAMAKATTAQAPPPPPRDIDVVVADQTYDITGLSWDDLYQRALMGADGLSVGRCVFGLLSPKPAAGQRWWRDGERQDGLPSLYREGD